MPAPQNESESRLYRSALYIPASKPRALEKAQALSTDVIVFDLEDAVAPDEKDSARATLIDALGRYDYGRRLKLVRLNGLDTPWGAQDAMQLADAPIDGLLLPKVSGPERLDALALLAPKLPLWAMMETPLAMLNAREIAAHPRLKGMVMGTNDLAKDLGSRDRPDRLAMQAGLGLCLLAARAYGLVILDGVYNAFRDLEGLEAECQQGRDMGFDGKSLIHPDQLAIANQIFSPSPAEIALAQRQMQAYEAAVAGGQAVAVVDGRIVENLHVESARQMLARAALIDAERG